MIDWEDLTKDECVLCILRDKETKKAKRFEWAKMRSKTFDGIALAMAEQWG